MLFPPEWVPTAPYLALPSLTAVLRQSGIEVVQKDISVEAFDHYFTKDFIEFVSGRIERRLNALRANGAGLSDEEKQYKELFEHYTEADLEHHIEKVRRAKDIVRSKEFYEVEKLEWALNSFREIMEYISISYYPADINFYPVESNLNVYRPWVSEDLFNAPQDEDVNIYVDLCRQLVFPAIDAEKPDVVGISIGTPVQFMSGMTFCQMIREKYPDIHITVAEQQCLVLEEGREVTRAHRKSAVRRVRAAPRCRSTTNCTPNGATNCRCPISTACRSINISCRI